MSNTTQSNANRTGVLNPLSTADARNLLENIYKHTDQYHIMISKDDTLLAYDYRKDCFYKATHNDVWYIVDPIHELIDNLESTNGKDAALSANQGRVLKEWIDQHAIDFDEFKKETTANFTRVDDVLNEHGNELIRIDTRLTTEVKNLSDRITAEIEDTKEYIDAECLKLETKKANNNLDNVTDVVFHDKGIKSGLMDTIPLSKFRTNIVPNSILTDQTLYHIDCIQRDSVQTIIETPFAQYTNEKRLYLRCQGSKEEYISSLTHYNVSFNIKNLTIGRQYYFTIIVKIDGYNFATYGTSNIIVCATNNIECISCQVTLTGGNLNLSNGYIRMSKESHTVVDIKFRSNSDEDTDVLFHSSPTYPCIIKVNDDTISSHKSLDFDGIDTKTQRYRNYQFRKDIDSKIPLAQRGIANGVATLDSEGKVPFIQIPDVVLGQNLYGGTVAANNVCTLSERFKSKYKITALTLTANNAQPYEGSYFIATGSGTIGGIANVNPSDWIISSGIATWNKIDNTDSVTSVAGRTGAITLTKNDVGLNNVDNTADANKRVSYANTAGSAPASDVSAWAKAANKPVYNAGEVGAMPNQNNNLETVSNVNETYIRYRINDVIKGHTGASNNMSFLHNANGKYLKNCNDGGLRFGTGLDQTGADIYRSDFMQPILPAMYNSDNIANPNKFGKNTLGCCMAAQTILGNNNFKNWIIADAYNYNDVGGATALAMDRQTNRLFLLRSNADRTVWNDAAEVWHSSNLIQDINPTANTVLKRNFQGYAKAIIFEDVWPSDRQPIGSIIYKNNIDSFHRSCPPDHLITQLGLFSNKSISIDQPSGTEHLFGVHASRITSAGYVSRIQFVSYRPTNTWATFRLKIGLNDASTLFRIYSFDPNGNFTCDGNVNCANVYFTSDERLKQNIIKFNNASNLDNVETYSYKKNNESEIGYIAQQVKSIAPEFVSEDENGYLSVNYTAIHSAKISILEDKVKELSRLIKAK